MLATSVPKAVILGLEKEEEFKGKELNDVINRRIELNSRI